MLMHKLRAGFRHRWARHFRRSRYRSGLKAITVEKVVWTRKGAESEVSRLNQSNEHEGTVYFWTFTRVEQRYPPKSPRRRPRTPLPLCSVNRAASGKHLFGRLA